MDSFAHHLLENRYLDHVLHLCGVLFAKSKKADEFEKLSLTALMIALTKTYLYNMKISLTIIIQSTSQ